MQFSFSDDDEPVDLMHNSPDAEQEASMLQESSMLLQSPTSSDKAGPWSKEPGVVQRNPRLVNPGIDSPSHNAIIMTSEQARSSDSKSPMPDGMNSEMLLGASHVQSQAMSSNEDDCIQILDEL